MTTIDDERAFLECFGPDTYGLEIPRKIAKSMECKGWIEWVPPKFGTTLYGITNAGRKKLQDMRANHADLVKP